MIKIRKRKDSWKVYNGAYLLYKIVSNSVNDTIEIDSYNQGTIPHLVIRSGRMLLGTVVHYNEGLNSLYIDTGYNDIIIQDKGDAE